VETGSFKRTLLLTAFVQPSWGALWAVTIDDSPASHSFTSTHSNFEVDKGHTATMVTRESDVEVTACINLKLSRQSFRRGT
jgi:hypothetical protein